MQPIAYGDSYGGVAQNALALDAARDSRYFQSLADNRDRQREADTFSLGQQGLDQARAEAQARQSEFQFNNSLAQQQLQQQAYEAQQNRQNELALTQLRVSPYENKLDARTKLGVYQQVYQGINNGTIRTPGDLAASASGVLDPGDMDRLAVALDGAHAKMSTAFQQQQGIAHRFNSDFAMQLGPYYPAYHAAAGAAAAAPPASSLNWWQNRAPNFLGGVNSQESFQNNQAINNYTTRLNNFEAGLTKNPAMRSIQFDPGNPLHPFTPLSEDPAQWGAGSAASSTDAGVSQAAPSSTAWQPVPSSGFEWHPDAYQRLVSALSAVSNPNDKKVVALQQLKMAEAAGQARPLSTPQNSLGLPTSPPLVPPSTPLTSSGADNTAIPGILPGMPSGLEAGSFGGGVGGALPASW